MKDASKREKFLFWLIKNSNKGWLWVLVIVASTLLTNSGMGLLIGLGLVIFGALTFAAGINLALGATLGDDYATKGLRWKNKVKEKTNDAS